MAVASPGVTFPWGTLSVNVLGSTLLGVIAGLAAGRRVSIGPRSFLAAGFCGGFTTFSAFDVESLSMLLAGRYLLYACYATSSVLICLAGVTVGLRLSGQGRFDRSR